MHIYTLLIDVSVFHILKHVSHDWHETSIPHCMSFLVISGNSNFDNFWLWMVSFATQTNHTHKTHSQIGLIAKKIISKDNFKPKMWNHQNTVILLKIPFFCSFFCSFLWFWTCLTPPRCWDQNYSWVLLSVGPKWVRADQDRDQTWFGAWVLRSCTFLTPPYI